jgi:polysaccharide export outer membrane protein
MRSFFSLLIMACVVLFSSCRPQRAVFNYLEDMNDTTTQKPYFITEPVIQKNDMLQIEITSASLDPTVDALYDYGAISSGRQGAGSVAGFGFLVDQHGRLEIPRIGMIKAEGLTKFQLADTIKARLKDQLVNPTVVIRFTNFRIVVIGEVGSPGVKTVGVENLTLLEALALAGDIPTSGKKKEVKILREVNGKRQLGIVDVTSSKMFESPYYQLQQNDVVMVERTRYSIRREEQGRISQQLGFALSIITSIALLYNIFNR